MAAQRKRPPSGPPLMPRVIAAIRALDHDFRAGEVVDLVGDPRRESVLAFVGVCAERGLCHVVGYEDLPTGGTCCVYRPGPPPANYVAPIFVRRGGSTPLDRAPTQSELERSEKQWRARARGAARYDAALTANEAAQIRELRAWRVS